MKVIQEFINKAQILKPQIIHQQKRPNGIVKPVMDDCAFQGWKMETLEKSSLIKKQIFQMGDSVVLDFGEQVVGYLCMDISSIGSPQDAPLKMKLTFGEMPCEIGEKFEDYNGWLSSSWLQEELIFVDILPITLKLPRRYSFRYLKIEILDTSPKYQVLFSDIFCDTITSGDITQIDPLPNHVSSDLKNMDKIAIRTLQNCMQNVFEDGPKRDRRLWIGDLRLQALTNYKTFKNYDLVKRCLYLFAGLVSDSGQVAACVFEKPYLMADDTFLYDYSLLFVVILYDYYINTHDIETVRELWLTAVRQIELGLERLDKNGVVKDDITWWSFIDWHPELNKQTSSQAVLIYCIRRGIKLAQIIGDIKMVEFLKERLQFLVKASQKFLWDKEKNFFVSGKSKQISWASQIWMVLAEVLDKQASLELLYRLFSVNPQIGIVTPYMYHHLLEALILCGDRKKALEQMNLYWGGMMRDGANCFWEIYNMKNKQESPYGSNLINSYCHGWSCTPSYFIRKYFI